MNNNSGLVSADGEHIVSEKKIEEAHAKRVAFLRSMREEVYLIDIAIVSGVSGIGSRFNRISDPRLFERAISQSQIKIKESIMWLTKVLQVVGDKDYKTIDCGRGKIEWPESKTYINRVDDMFNMIKMSVIKLESNDPLSQDPRELVFCSESIKKLIEASGWLSELNDSMSGVDDNTETKLDILEEEN